MSEAQNQEYLLDVKNLTTYFPITEGIVITRPVAQVHAVENVTFGIRPGETLSLVGESGCGKTTTGRTIIGLEKATSGEINFEGKPVKDLSQDERRKFSQSVQMIFQDPYSSLNPRMSISDTLAEPIRVHKLMERSEIDSRIVDLLQKVNLPPEFGKRYPHEFSGGQRQRISIARALALNPRVIICDEAVSALDVSVQAQIIDLLIELQQEFGLAMMFISHDLAVVREISHRIMVLYLGRVVELADRNTIYENPVQPYTKALIAAVPNPDPNIERTREFLRLSGDLPSPLDRRATLRFMKSKLVDDPDVDQYRPSLVEVAPGHLVAEHDPSDVSAGLTAN